jgi:hypothetical protein
MSVLMQRQTVSVKRYTAGTYTAGVYVNGSNSTISLVGAIQASAGSFEQDLKDLGLEGRDVKGVIKVFTTQPLYTIDSSPSKQADRVILDSEEYEVRAVAAWQQGIVLKHYKSIAVKL